MSTVTVPGAQQSNVPLSFDSDVNASLASQVAGAISAGLASNMIQAFDSANGSPPVLPSGVTGELVLSHPGVTLLSDGYDFVVDAATKAVVYGNGDANENVLAGSGKLTFFAASGSGTIITGGGKDNINIAASDHGNWLIATGNARDSISALGSGNDTISAGSGKTQIQLGSGNTFITTTGSNTVVAGSGSETINASLSKGSQVIFGNASNLFFTGGGAATVFGGSGSATVSGGRGNDLFQGGSGGNNILTAGSGSATLFGGGNGDQLYASGDKSQLLQAASGNETLGGAFASGADTFKGGSGSDQITGGFGSNTFVAGAGASTVTAGPGAANVFEFVKGAGGGTEFVTGLTDASQVSITLSGFGWHEMQYALSHQTASDGADTIKLSDNTTVTFENVGALTAGNFNVTGGHGRSEAPDVLTNSGFTHTHH